MSSRPLTFQERREAHAQRHGNFVSLLEENEDDDIPLRTPVASPVASFDASDVAEAEGSNHGTAVAVLSVPNAEADSVAAAPLQPRKPKALPGPKTYVNDAHVDLRLNMAAQLRRLNIHKVTNVSSKKQGKVDLYQANVLSPDGCMHGLQPYTCDDPYKKFWALIMCGVKHDAQNFEHNSAEIGDDNPSSLQTLQALSHKIFEEMNTAEDAAKKKTAEAKRKAVEIQSANQASEAGLGLRTPTKRSSAPILGAQPSARIRSEQEQNEALAATAGVSDIKYGKGEKKKVKRDLDYVEKMDQMFECMKQQPVDLLSIVKEIQRAVPATAAPAVAADSPEAKYNRRFRDINSNIKMLMEQKELAKRNNEPYDHIDRRLKKQNEKLDALDDAENN
jgi:hypothetical protein